MAELRVAIVTGAASGIGRAIALRLAADGLATIVNHLPGDEDAARGVVGEIRSAGGTAEAVAADMGDVRSVRKLVAAASPTFGRLNVLVNNAAWAFTKPFGDVTEADFDRIFAVNVKGPFFACQTALEVMSDGGRIINISTSTTALMLPGYGVYDATKGALEMITRILCKEVGKRGITVNTISPGATETEQFRAGKSDTQIEGLKAMSAFGRLGTPQEIAEAVAFIASERAGWITGQNIRVNGGTA